MDIVNGKHLLLIPKQPMLNLYQDLITKKVGLGVQDKKPMASFSMKKYLYLKKYQFVVLYCSNGGKVYEKSCYIWWR